MLISLSIRNIVLIDKLDVTFEGGLTVLTGETGAGKSILLDALNLALGERAQSSLIRHGENQATVTAAFEVAGDSALKEVFEAAGLDFEESLVLRRTIARDGKSRAFVNDQPVSIALLSQLSERLIEVHGQFDKLLSPSTHMDLLDVFGDHQEDINAIRDAFDILEERKKALMDFEVSVRDGKAQLEFWRYAEEELSRLAPKMGEIETLEAERLYLGNRAKIVEALSIAAQSFQEDGGIEALFKQVFRQVERVHTLAPQKFAPLFESCTAISEHLGDANHYIAQYLSEDDDSVLRLEGVEKRLYALHEVARKHHVDVDALETFLKELSFKVTTVVGGEAHLLDLGRQVEEAREMYLVAAQALTLKRLKTAERLDVLVNQELPPLKLEAAAFKTEIAPLVPERWGRRGVDLVEFMVRTNSGHPFGALGKIASGGERSRFMLALKVILAHEGAISTLIFDEIDSGVSGGVASAIGVRLARLGQNRQVFAITHSALVAACADHHYSVQKTTEGDQVTTSLKPLTASMRETEVARLIGGDALSDSALQAAKALLNK
ncbi:MAG: DNA repair protein RecN [Alphaproteobacteria bacterium]|nr:DNA repair protein RecN [Alphaproteobacteria bacterium]